MNDTYTQQAKSGAGPRLGEVPVGNRVQAGKEIPQLVDKLQSEVNSLDETIQAVCERSASAAEAERPSDQPDANKENIRTELGQQLSHLLSRIRSANCRLLDLNERIQL